MKEGKKEYTQLNELQEFEILETPIFAGIVHSRETIALKRVCENLGLDWHGQRQRLQRNEAISQLSVQAKHTADDGKKYEMLCLPPLAFQDWLYSLNEVQSENLNRELLQEYQHSLVIELLMMLKMSLDEIDRLKGIETNYEQLARDVQALIEKDEEGRELNSKSKTAFKEKKEIQSKIIEDLRNGMNQLRINF